MKKSLARSVRLLVLVGTVSTSVFFSTGTAHAAVSCTAYIHNTSYTRSTGKAHATGAAFCSSAVYALHVSVRIWRTDVNPDATIAANSQTCFSAITCPANSTDYVHTNGLIDNGCHTYEARARGNYTPYGEPPDVSFPAFGEDVSMGTLCR